VPISRPVVVEPMRHYAWVAQRSWPERFEVTLRLADGGERVSSVVTWRDADKAVEIAKRHVPSGLVVTESRAAPLGPAPRAGNGTVELTGDLHDRMEW
jgi:hypothetical protein